MSLTLFFPIFAATFHQPDKIHEDVMTKDASSEIISPLIDGQKADLRYWVEASGRIEHYFKKHHAYPMLNTLASQMLNVDASHITPSSKDHVHYTRQIGTDGDCWEKMIFGATDEVFRTVMEEIEQYGSFMQGAALLDEGGQDAVRRAKHIIENIYRATRKTASTN